LIGNLSGDTVAVTIDSDNQYFYCAAIQGIDVGVAGEESYDLANNPVQPLTLFPLRRKPSRGD